MALTLDSVRKLLAPDELDYAALARMGPQLLPHLNTLIARGNPHDASKAAYLIGMMRDARAAKLLRGAVKHRSAVVRAAAAGALANQKSADANSALAALLGDRDAGVRKLAIKSSVGKQGDRALVAKLRSLGQRDPSRQLRALALRAAGRTRIG